MECLCDSGIDLDSLRDKQGYSPLTYASKLNMQSIANYISLRVKNIDDEDPEGRTAFSREVLRASFE
jgi:ankyrin repeat protein